MGRISLIFAMTALSVALPLFALPQEEPLGDVAKQLRAQRGKETRKATKVFTNDDLPSRPPEATGPTESAPVIPESISGKKPTPEKENSKSPDGKMQTRDHWQSKFTEARRNLAHAQEQQQLVEDELNLLQIQEARELNINFKQEISAKVQSKQTDVEMSHTATADARRRLENLEQEFKDSGAPDDWKPEQ
jgi:hypothetical protein